jgi:lipopolysaccharide transport system permease protein
MVMAELSPPIQNYEVVIEPSTGWLNFRWRELWDYRDLLILLVQRDFISRYKQTILGPLWFIVQPVLTTIVFMIVFGRVAGMPTDGVPGPLFYLCGLLGWNYFSQNVTTAGATFVNNSHLFGKVWFPRVIMPISTIVSNVVAFALQLIPFILFFVYYKFATPAGASIHLDWRFFLWPLALLHLALLSLGVSLWISAATAKYRDLVHLTQFLIQLWMYASPIIYSLSQARAKWPWIIAVNPVAVPCEAFRVCLLGRGSIETHELVLSVVMTLVLLFTGLAVYQKVESTAVDSV